ncbi:hypothetical protein Mapa_005491 [Marchantia paleacea]|nr:hypothetical protein Mapa_005491 [Marchantia paleacea]
MCLLAMRRPILNSLLTRICDLCPWHRTGKATSPRSPACLATPPLFLRGDGVWTLYIHARKN